MVCANRSMGAMMGCMVLIGASQVFAQDWPQWRGPGRDGKVTGFTAPPTWPKAFVQQWKITVGTGDATPALVGDKLYVFTRQGDEEIIACLSAADGSGQWKNRYAAPPVTGAAARHPGPRSSPLVAQGKVVTLGASGILSCLDVAAGTVLWRNDEYKAVPLFFTGLSPLLAEGRCIVHLGGKGKGAVVALDLASGGAKWKWEGEGPAYASPVLLIADGTTQVVLQAEKSLLGIGLTDGKLLWQVATPPQGRFFNSASPVVDGQTVIYTGQGAGTKAVKIDKQGEAFAPKELWSNSELGTGYNTPVLKDGLLFGISNRGSLFCLHAKTGKTLWADSATRKDSFGSLLDAGSVMLALQSGGELVAFKPSDKQYEELARVKVAQTATYAHPVIAGKRIYIKDQDSLTLWTLE